MCLRACHYFCELPSEQLSWSGTVNPLSLRLKDASEHAIASVSRLLNN